MSSINKKRGDFNLSNKQELGFDAQGGIKAGKVPENGQEMQHCMEESKEGRAQSLLNREKIEKQNFNVKPAK
jgi:hypothetical protein